MCPLPPVSLQVVDDNIDVHSSDEEVVLFLERRRAGDPVPSNVITGVNPFGFDPLNSPEGIWFLYSSKDSQFHNDGSIVKVTNGYWRSMDFLTISTSTPTVGRRTTWEFFVGQAPFGDTTFWRMHEYQAEQIAAQRNNKSQDNITLCRFFLQNDERPNSGEQCDPMSADDADGEYIEFESMLLSLLQQEETNSSLRDAANGSQVVGEGEQRQLELSSRPPQDLANDNPVEDMQAACDFSKEDYLELKDLYDPESSSSSSDNSSIMSKDSDEYFDAEALSRDIENEGRLNLEEQQIDYRYSITTSVVPNQVVISPPPAGSNFSNNSNLVVRDNDSANPIPSRNPILSSSNADLRRNSDASSSGSSQGSNGNEIHSGSSPGESTSRSLRSKSVRRMAKLGKKYCCFGSF